MNAKKNRGHPDVDRIERRDRPATRHVEIDAHGLGRRAFVHDMLMLGGGLVLGGCTAMPATAPDASRPSGGRVAVRWLGGGVTEIATSDYKQIAYDDAWIWNNTGWDRFGIRKPPEYASKEGFVRYVADKKPDAVFVLLTHDHGDHIGDYFEMLQGLVAAGLPVMTTGQSDLMRKGLVDDFKRAGLDPKKIVANEGAGMNFGGVARHGAMTAHLVPAIHSNLHGFPAAGFMLDIGGMRIYLSGDTDLFGEMKTLGERYRPNLGIVCVGDGAYTMGPEDAARACQWVGVSRAIPVHYAHNALVRGVEAGEEFRRALANVAPNVTATVLRPGESRIIQTSR
ncbi:MAG TPA: MBL fold metallo-hydrolase [Casimicrobiaceae bacterium]|nr:MBL fold metallo-hydrolase [Casimicrobiaceae bacterium]